MTTELENLRIDRTEKPPVRSSQPRTIVALAALLAACGAAGLAWRVARPQVKAAARTARQAPATPAVRTPAGEGVLLNATGYIVAAHKIDVASKVSGKVAWIGVDKGDHVSQGQPLVRLEDDDYRAQILQAQGNLANLQAKLAELEHGSRPEQIAEAKADVASAKADLRDYAATLDRTRALANAGVAARQTLDDAEAKYNAQAAKVASLEQVYDLARLGPRPEEIAAARALVTQAQGSLDYARSQLEDTVIRAPVAGTILERNVEKGEFVTTGFAGDKGAKGYVVSLANLNDLQVELDINESDFARLKPRQRGIITTDAYPDRRYQGYLYEMSPEANRQKATVQVKVRILKPDQYLRPDMNASVAFLETTMRGKL